MLTHSDRKTTLTQSRGVPCSLEYDFLVTSALPFALTIVKDHRDTVCHEDTHFAGRTFSWSPEVGKHFTKGPGSKCFWLVGHVASVAPPQPCQDSEKAAEVMLQEQASCVPIQPSLWNKPQAAFGPWAWRVSLRLDQFHS